MLELFGLWRSVCARFPDEKQDALPLDPDRSSPACNKSCKAGPMLFAFKRVAPIALTLSPRHYAAKSTTPGQWLCTNEGQGFSAFVFHSPRMFRRARALCRLTKPCTHNVLVDLESATSSSCLWVKGGVWSAGKDVISDLGRQFSLRPPYPRHFHDQGISGLSLLFHAVGL